MDLNNQKSVLDEIMEKMEEIQREARAVDAATNHISEEPLPVAEEESASVDGIVDGDLFDQIKGEKKYVPSKPEKKSAIRRFLDEEDAENSADDEYVGAPALYDEAPVDIEDFRNEDEREEIYRDLRNTVGKMAFKSLFLLILSAASVYLFIASFYPVLFGGNVDGIGFNIALLLVDILCIGISLGIFGQGLALLLRGRCDTDTLLALMSVFLVVVRVAEMIRPDFIPHSLTLEPFLAIGLYFNIQSKKKIAANIKNNFKMISMNGDKLTVTVPPSCEANNDLILETGEGGDVMYAHRTALVSDYIDHSYSDYSWDDKIHRFLFVIVLLVIACTVVVSQLVGLGAGLLFPAATFALSVPFFSRYFYALSIWKNGKKIRKNGGILTSAKSAKELEDADLIVISEEDFIEDGSVLLQGVKAMGDIQIDDLITNIAALFNVAGTPLKPLFLKMIDRKSVELPRVDDVYYHSGMGYSCLVHSKMFLVGNRALMEQFNIEFPQELKDIKLKEGHYPVYVAYHKSPAGIFIASIEHSRRTKDALKLIEDECVGLGIVSKDFLFDRSTLEHLYPQYPKELVHFIKLETGAKCEDQLERKDKSSDLIASVAGPRGLMACLYGASKLLSALKINLVIRIIYTIVSIALMLFIALAGYSANTALQIMAFQLIWLLPVWLVCNFCK